jgi:hypothetical protein
MENDIINTIKTKLYELEEKSRFYKLKRFEKNLMKKYRNILLSNDKKGLIDEKIKENQKKFENNIREENENFNREKELIEKEKKEKIKSIETNTKSKINENEKKYKKLLSHLDTIKNDKKKLIEFFKNSNYFKYF